MMFEISDLERLILRTLLENGASTLLDIAVRSLVQPDRVVDAVSSLLDKGLIRAVERPKGIERRVYLLTRRGVGVVG